MVKRRQHHQPHELKQLLLLHKPFIVELRDANRSLAKQLLIAASSDKLYLLIHLIRALAQGDIPAPRASLQALRRRKKLSWVHAHFTGEKVNVLLDEPPQERALRLTTLLRLVPVLPIILTPIVESWGPPGKAALVIGSDAALVRKKGAESASDKGGQETLATTATTTEASKQPLAVPGSSGVVGKASGSAVVGGVAAGKPAGGTEPSNG